MAEGDTVTIYRDPITQTKPEGAAVLIRLWDIEGKGEHWQIRFVGAEKLVNRWIYPVKDNA